MALVDLREQNRTKLEDSIRSWRSWYQYDPTTLVARTWGGINTALDARDTSITPYLVHDGFWQIWIYIALARFLKEGSVVVDVGANVGAFALPFSRIVGNSGKVICYEPQERAADLLQLSINLNLADNIEIRRKGCGRKASNRESLYTFPQNLGAGGSLNESFQGHLAIKNSMEVARLCDEVERADLIKIDVEGKDLEVIEGAIELLDRSPGCIVAFEYWEGLPVEELEKAVERFGLQLWAIDYSGSLRPYSRDGERVADYVATRG